MELIRARAWAGDRRPADLPLSLKLTYAIQACRALDYAHKRGIVHRDIRAGKREMLSKDGTVKVVDSALRGSSSLRRPKPAC